MADTSITDDTRTKVETPANVEEASDPATNYLSRLLEEVKHRTREKQQLRRKEVPRPAPRVRYNLD